VNVHKYTFSPIPLDENLFVSYTSSSTYRKKGLHPLRGMSDAGDHKGLVKIPRIFLAPPLLTTLAPTETFPRKDGGPEKIFQHQGCRRGFT